MGTKSVPCAQLVNIIIVMRRKFYNFSKLIPEIQDHLNKNIDEVVPPCFVMSLKTGISHGRFPKCVTSHMFQKFDWLVSIRFSELTKPLLILRKNLSHWNCLIILAVCIICGQNLSVVICSDSNGPHHVAKTWSIVRLYLTNTGCTVYIIFFIIDVEVKRSGHYVKI